MKKDRNTSWSGIAFLAAITVLIISSASAEGFGVYSQEKTKTISGNATEFELLLVNAGKPTSLLVSASGIDGGTLWIEKGSLSRQISGSAASINLDRSVPKSSGEELIQVGDRFLNATALKLRFEADEPDKKIFEFDLELTQKLKGEENTELGQDVVNTRSYSYRIRREGAEEKVGSQDGSDKKKSPEGLEKESGGGFESLFEGFEEDLSIDFSSESSEDESAALGREPSEREGSDQNMENEETDGKSKSSDKNLVTYLLAAGVLASLIYLLKVV